MPTSSSAITLLTHQLDLAFDKRSWHGPNLCGALRGVQPDEAVWRPQRGRHNIAELLVHAAYWKYRICRLIAEGDVPAFELTGSDFFERRVADKAQWAEDLLLLRTWHHRLRDYVLALPSRRLGAATKAANFSVTDVILGAAAHDLYHAGQIRLLRRMYRD